MKALQKTEVVVENTISGFVASKGFCHCKLGFFDRHYKISSRECFFYINIYNYCNIRVVVFFFCFMAYENNLAILYRVTI